MLWGRIVALGVVLLLVFLLGRATGGDGSGEQVEDLQARLASAQAEIEQLDRQVRAASTTIPSGAVTDTTVTTPPSGTVTTPGSAGAVTTTAPATGTTATSTTVATEDEIYTIKSGDTLRGIAGRVYGKTSLSSCIAKAQTPPIVDETKIQIGQKITIPRPTPTAPC